MIDEQGIPKIELVKIKLLKTNPNNPKIIRDEKFFKLVKSIHDFPEMLQIRPIVVNDEWVVLGGNMRLKACLEAKLKEVYVINAKHLTKEQQDRFIIADNVNFGEWDYDDLSNQWEVKELIDWGLDLPYYHTANDMSESDLEFDQSFDTVGKMKNVQRVVLLFDNSEKAEEYLKKNRLTFEKRNMAWQVNLCTQSI